MVSANDSKKTVTLFKRTPKQQMMLNCIALFVAPRTVSSRDRYRGCQERTVATVLSSGPESNSVSTDVMPTLASVPTNSYQITGSGTWQREIPGFWTQVALEVL
ncbi:uncharacterized protein WM294_000372 isoform 1-T1 [Sarcoramphus papa]